jgi:hypothetical protein
MVLDHLIVEKLDKKEEEKLDVQGWLLHGLKALFEDNGEHDIRYDDNDIENLLDRSKIEDTIQQPAEEESLGSFKTARIWANSTAKLQHLEDKQEDILEADYWDRIIKERVKLAKAVKEAELANQGRGKRRAAKKVKHLLEVANFRLITLNSSLARLKRSMEMESRK